MGLVVPLANELGKPAVLIPFLGRIRSAQETFLLGLACGVAFGGVEAAVLSGAVFDNWLTIAVVVVGFLLVEGLGGALMALGWYYLTVARPRRILLAFGCWLCAILQHILVNTTLLGPLLPDPLGQAIRNTAIPFDSGTVPISLLIYAVEILPLLALFVLFARWLRREGQSAGQRKP